MKIALIPAAKCVDSELAFDFGEVTPLLLPIKGRPLFCELEKQFELSGHSCFYLLDSNDEKTATWLKNLGISEKRIIKIFNSLSLEDTILQGMEAIKNWKVEHLIINFADTIVRADTSCSNSIYYSSSNQMSRWATLSMEGDKLRFQDKVECGISESTIVTGRFEFESFALLYEILWRKKTFYSALETYHESIPFELLRSEAWFDFGHIDKYLESKSEYSFNEREFNQIKVDLPRGVITKSSKKKIKLKQEFDWYKELPEDLKNFVPTVYAYENLSNKDRVHFEFLPFPPLNDIFLYSDKPYYYWEKFFSSLTKMIGDFWHDRHSITSETEDLVNMYSNKTWERFEYIKRKEMLSPAALLSLEKQIRIAIEVILSDSGSKFFPLHGDMCLSNILFDGRSGHIKLIDPRGKFGKFQFLGDLEYDLAKLSHSFNGNYDFIVNGLFKIKEDKLEVFKTEKQKVITSFFNDWLSREFPGRERIVRLKEALLFISMVPLHEDRPVSQYGFLMNGREILLNHL